MKIYLAGGMRGIPEENRPAFDNKAAELRLQGHTVFNPHEYIDEHPGITFKHGFAADLNFICTEAEAIYLLPGWTKSIGARAEWTIAVQVIDLIVMGAPK